MGSEKLSIADLITFMLVSASTVVLPKNFPDLTIIALLYFSLKYESPSLIFWTFLSGLAHDGFNTNKIWTSPILFPALTIITGWAKDNFNLSFAPARIIFTVSFVIATFCAYMLTWNLTLTEILLKLITTLFLAIITSLLV